MSEEWSHPIETGKPNEGKVDLGDGHWLAWSEYQGSTCGGIITHTSTKTKSGICSGAFWTDNRYHEASKRPGPVWTWNGNKEMPTLSPSFLCHCGDHGYVREGKWVRA